jgi:hypothetical protein
MDNTKLRDFFLADFFYSNYDNMLKLCRGFFTGFLLKNRNSPNKIKRMKYAHCSIVDVKTLLFEVNLIWNDSLAIFIQFFFAFSYRLKTTKVNIKTIQKYFRLCLPGPNSIF